MEVPHGTGMEWPGHAGAGTAPAAFTGPIPDEAPASAAPAKGGQ
jgi:hypothetical protein